MKSLLIFLAVILCSQSTTAQSEIFRYVSPKPNSILVSCETNIIMRSVTGIDRSSLVSTLLRAEGDRSGLHEGDMVLSDDGRTIVFNPHLPFSGNEVVTVVLQEGIRTEQGDILSGYSFRFTTMPRSEMPRKNNKDDVLTDGTANASAVLPAPPIKIDSVNNPSPGYIFLATWDRNVPSHKYANYLFILDNVGKIVDSMRVNGAPFDFQIQPNGQLSYGLGDYAGITPENSNLKHYVLDTSLAIVDSFQMKNGYLTDFHDFTLLPNGHAMLMSYHTVTYDMSLIAPGGRPDALVVINVFQEQDAEKNVVFEWRDIDYIPITDTDLKLTDPRINPSTLNAFELDYDGNLLLSFRNHSDIMKISRETGNVMWRLGGLKNEFTFIGEHQENAPYYFARQHDIHRLSNGNISLFDNGEFHVPWYSRAAEYTLDEMNKKATLVSEYRYQSGNINAQAAGNAHRLSGGGWFVGYGILSPTSPVMKNIVEVHPDGSTAFELSLPANVISYRVSKQPWRQLIQRTQVSNAEVQQGNTYSFNKNGKTTGVSITYVQLTGDSYNNVSITRIPFGPVKPEFIADAPMIYPVSLLYDGAAISSHISELHIALDAFPEIKQPAATSIFKREFAGQGLFVELPTTYDSTAGKLVARTTTFGEFIFGTADLRQGLAIPVLIEPLNKKKVLVGKPLLLKWAGHGLLQSFKIQIATDSLFQNTILDSVTANSFVQKTDLLQDQKYYWRVRANGSAGAGEWSSMWSFEPAGAFFQLTSPNGGEQIPVGKAIVVRWETNVSDSVKVNLIRGQAGAVLLGKTYSRNNAYQWNVSAGLTPDSTYRLSIVSYLDPAAADTSDAIFSLIKSTGIRQFGGEIPADFALFQNYPNPFNPATTIGFAIPSAQRVVVSVYDVLGREITVLLNELLPAGEHSVVFDAAHVPSGIYYYRMSAGDFVSTKKLIVIK